VEDTKGRNGASEGFVDGGLTVGVPRQITKRRGRRFLQRSGPRGAHGAARLILGYPQRMVSALITS